MSITIRGNWTLLGHPDTHRIELGSRTRAGPRVNPCCYWCELQLYYSKCGAGITQVSVARCEGSAAGQPGSTGRDQTSVQMRLHAAAAASTIMMAEYTELQPMQVVLHELIITLHTSACLDSRQLEQPAYV